jgi:hypothetical protein
VLSGLFLAIEYILIGGGPTADIAGLLSAVLGLFVVAALYLGQRKASGTLGGIGYIVNAFGLALIVGVAFTDAFVFSSLSESVVEEFMAGPVGLAFLVSFVIFIIGAVLFGIATILAKVYSSIAAVLYMVGFTTIFLSLLLSLPDTVATIGGLVAGVGIIWFGYALWSGTRESA